VTPLARPALLAALVLASCAAPSSPDGSAPPRRREEGPRWIAFSGGDPASRGWAKPDGLLWIEAAHADAFRRGYLHDGASYVRFEEADANARSAEDGHVLRTDHVLLRTDVPFARARRLAEDCERHAARVIAAFGEALDLRVPSDPLPVYVAARRREFEAWLRDKVPRPVEWGAFYHAATGRVFASDERREEGGLSTVADLRHEATHAILDRGSKDGVSPAAFSRPHFWIWEGAAVWSEGLGDPPDAREGRERFDRFRRRHAWADVVPLSTLFRLPQDQFLGRHYDQTASFMRWLMEADAGTRRPAALRLLARVVSGRAVEEDFARLVGLTPDDAERRWLSTLPP
jgi:hypothetical protein